MPTANRVVLTIRKLEQEILAEGHSVCILTTASGDPANTNLIPTHPNRRVIFINDAMPIPFINDPSNPEMPTYAMGFALSAATIAEIEDFEPSIIHITVPDVSALHLIEFARRKEIPLMGTYHSNIPEYLDHYPAISWLKHLLGAFFRHEYSFLQALYVPTPYIEKHLLDNFDMENATKLGIWGRGVDVDHFHPHHRSIKYRRSFGIEDDCTVICWVGRLVAEKRPDIFANVCRRLHARGENFHALVIGSGPVEEEFKTLPNTTFCGWMNADQLSVAYASSDIFLFPSAVETFGNVTLEAAASGLPVVVEAGCSGHLIRGGNGSWNGVRQGDNGFACPAQDEDAFFEATLELVRDGKLRASCSRSARKMSLTLEKKSVVRDMLDNYSVVTNQFFTKYGGHHANRDRVNQEQGAFRFGKHPRPLLIIFIIRVFMVSFLVINNMTSFFMIMQETFLAFATFSTSVSTNFLEEVEEERLLQAPSTNTRSNSPEPTSRRLSVSTASSPASGRSIRTVGMSNVESGFSSLEGRSNTSRGGSLSSSYDSVSGVCEVDAPQTRAWCRSETPIMHSLAKVFVAAVEWQCRNESQFRSGVHGCGAAVSMRFSMKREKSFVSVKKDD
jgi:phosphatidylinositol alpha 1,6-mannosyltransferase